MTTLAEAQAAPAAPQPAATPKPDAPKPDAPKAETPAAASPAAKPSSAPVATATPAADAKPAEKGEDQRAVNRIATLSREKREIEAKLTGVEKQAALDAADARALRDLKAAAPKDPRRVIKELGLTFEQLVDAFADGDDVKPATKDPVADVMAEVDKRFKERDDAEKQATQAKIQAETEAATVGASKNIGAQIASDPDRWEVLGRIESDPSSWKMLGMTEPLSLTATRAIMKLIMDAGSAGHEMSEKEIADTAAEVLDNLEEHYVSLGERYRKTRAKPGSAASDGTGSARTLADSQSERRPPKTIDPAASEGGILQRAQQGDGTSSDAVRARMKAALRASRVDLNR